MSDFNGVPLEFVNRFRQLSLDPDKDINPASEIYFDLDAEEESLVEILLEIEADYCVKMSVDLSQHLPRVWMPFCERWWGKRFKFFDRFQRRRFKPLSIKDIWTEVSSKG